MVEMFVPIGGMIMLVAMLGLITRLFAAGMLNRTIREALRSDPGSVPVLVERLDARPHWGDALLGWILLAMAVAMAILALTDPDHEARTEMLRAAIVPVIVGVTVLVYARWAARNAAEVSAPRLGRRVDEGPSA